MFGMYSAIRSGAEIHDEEDKTSLSHYHLTAAQFASGSFYPNISEREHWLFFQNGALLWGMNPRDLYYACSSKY
jgi:hypothetical protein